MDGMVWAFNSSNTALESAAVPSKSVSAGKWRVWAAGSLESSTSLPSARMRTRVALGVETERSSAVEFAWGGSSAGREAACAAPSDWVVTAEEGLPLRRAEYRRQAAASHLGGEGIRFSGAGAASAD